MTSTSPPPGYHTVTPYLIVKGANRLIEFLTAAFDASQVFLDPHPDGSVRHAELKIGDSKVMLSEARDGHPPMPCMIFLYVDDVDESYRRALAAGGTSVREPRDESHGDRMGGVTDPVGGQWWMATRIGPLRRPDVAEEFSG
jgi:PhnB protein